MRLIDADELWEKMYKYSDNEGAKMPYGDDDSLIHRDSACFLIENAPTIEPEYKKEKWIPCSERMPEEDVEVLIAYRYKKGEGNTSHTYIDISTYGQLYFGGNKVENKKHWRQPFAYFESNYEVIAWMPLPAPYQPKEDES